jgi:hypothetical protein
VIRNFDPNNNFPVIIPSGSYQNHLAILQVQHWPNAKLWKREWNYNSQKIDTSFQENMFHLKVPYNVIARIFFINHVLNIPNNNIKLNFSKEFGTLQWNWLLIQQGPITWFQLPFHSLPSIIKVSHVKPRQQQPNGKREPKYLSPIQKLIWWQHPPPHTMRDGW